MVFAAKIMLGVVGGGALLGSLLGAFANPVMKAAPEAPWRGALVSPGSFAAATPYIEPLPEDLTPPNVPDSYVPAIALTELSEPQSYWAPLPEYDSEGYASWSEERRDMGEAGGPMEEPAPAERSGVRVDLVHVAETAAAAETAAEEAVLAAPQAPEAPQEQAPLTPLY